MRSTLASLAFSALTLTACGDDAAPMMDGGPMIDGGPMMDVGPDVMPMMDAGPDAMSDGGMDAGPDVVDAGPPLPEPPESIFFVGNSFTFGGPIPTLVRDLAAAGGHPVPDVDYRAVGGRTLRWHREDTDPENAPNRVGEGWDVVVLQEYSTGATDSAGDPMRFKEDATWFHDLARNAQPDCRVVLYETWARRFNHGIYPGTFDDPEDMQAQIRFHYNDAADNYIPAMTMLEPNVVVAPAGDAWELQLMGGEPPKLHGDDDYHAGRAGQYLNALVIYSTIYGTATMGLDPLVGLSEEVATMLQEAADAVTGNTAPPPGLGMPSMPVGHTVRVDVGPNAAEGWATLTNGGSAGPLMSDEGAMTTVSVSASGFTGNQTGGSSDNDFGWPGDVSADSLYVGSFDGHDAALDLSANVRIRRLPAGRYELFIFASRDGNDDGRQRVGRYGVGEQSADLDASDNVGMRATLTLTSEGTISINVGVSPEGASRFAYVGAIELTRVE